MWTEVGAPPKNTTKQAPFGVVKIELRIELSLCIIVNFLLYFVTAEYLCIHPFVHLFYCVCTGLWQREGPSHWSGERKPPKNMKKSKAMIGNNNNIDSKAEKHVDPLGETMEEGSTSTNTEGTMVASESQEDPK